VTRAALKLSALLLLRPREVRHMEWAWFDLEGAVLTVPAGVMKRSKADKKDGPPHVVPLALQAVAILRELHPLTGHGRYVFPSLLVSRLRERQFDPAQATEVASAGNVKIKIQRVLDAQGHALLYCHSPAREQKDRAIDDTKAAGFEAVLAKLQPSLSKPRGTKDVAKIMERLGRAKQRFSRAAQRCNVDVAKDKTGLLVQAITWTKKIKPGSAAMHPGVPPGGAPCRRAPVHQRAGLPLRAHATPAAQGQRRPRQLGGVACGDVHAAARDRDDAAPRRPRCARAQGHAARGASPQDRHDPGAVATPAVRTACSCEDSPALSPTPRGTTQK